MRDPGEKRFVSRGGAEGGKRRQRWRELKEKGTRSNRSPLIRLVAESDLNRRPSGYAQGRDYRESRKPLSRQFIT